MITSTSRTATQPGLHGAHRQVVVIGGGQAGLSMSWWLTNSSVEHVVLERDRVGSEWRNRRWDSFCLVTPNWQCTLPGYPYPGTDPDGFMLRDEVVAYLEDFAASFAPPLYEGVAATRLRGRPGGGFEVITDAGTVTADQVVVAAGPYQVPLTPRMAERLPDDVVQIHSSRYRHPGQLPPGEVLVVGTGQSGCQIAEDLHLAGRRVHLATGSAPRVARFYRGRDVVAWLDDMGYYRKSVRDFDDVDAVRFRVNHYVTGRDGGRDIDLRAFARDGMALYGRLSGITDGRLSFARNLRHNLDAADAVSEGIKDSIDTFIAARGLVAPEEARYVPVWAPDQEPASLDLRASGITAVVWCTGFGRDQRWIELPIFDGRGYPTHDRGVTSYAGLYFLGLPWQHTWGSGRFSGVSDDAEHLSRAIAAHQLRAVQTGLHWLAGTPSQTSPVDDEDWIAPRTVA